MYRTSRISSLPYTLPYQTTSTKKDRPGPSETLTHEKHERGYCWSVHAGSCPFVPWLWAILASRPEGSPKSRSTTHKPSFAIYRTEQALRCCFLAHRENVSHPGSTISGSLAFAAWKARRTKSVHVRARVSTRDGGGDEDEEATVSRDLALPCSSSI